MSNDKEKCSKVLKYFSFTLALVIIVAYIIFFGIVMILNPANNYEGLKTVAATFGTIVAAVVGYYFGQRPAEQAIQSAQESKGRLVESASSDVEVIGDSLVNYRKNRGRLLDMLERLIAENEEK